MRDLASDALSGLALAGFFLFAIFGAAALIPPPEPPAPLIEIAEPQPR